MNHPIAELVISEEIGVARVAEVVLAGVTVAAGDGPIPSELAVRDADGQSWPVQTLARAHAGDDSSGWLSLAFPVTVSGTERRVVRLEEGPASEVWSDPVTVRSAPLGFSAVWSGQRVEMTSGGYLIQPGSFLPGGLTSSIELDGKHARAVVREVVVRHDGPLVAVFDMTGDFEVGGTPVAGLEATIRITAGRPAVDVALALVANGVPDVVELESWIVGVGMTEVRRVQLGAFERVSSARPPLSFGYAGGGHARGIFTVSNVDGGADWRDESDSTYWDRWEWAELQGRPAQNWAVLEGDERSWTVAVERFCEHYPARTRCTENQTVVELYAGDGDPALLARGSAPRRQIRIAAESDRLAGAVLDCPVVPFDPDTLGKIRPDVLPYLPEEYPLLEGQIRTELFGWYLSGQQMGFYDHGDGLQAIGEGPRRGYSSNNEHDAILALVLHYLRSGERAYLDSAVAYADHTIDIDQIHATDYPHELHGLRAHGKSHLNYVEARTVSGTTRTSIDTGHMWVEGLVQLARVTGEMRYLDAARKVGDCLAGLESAGWTRPEPGPRNAGWPLIALSCLAEATGDERYLAAARRIAKTAIERQRPDGRWLMRLGHLEDYGAWQNSVLLTGLCRLLALDEIPDVRAAVARGGRALLDLGRTRQGTFVALTRFDYRWTNYSALVREALAALYVTTGSPEFISAGLPGGRHWYAAPGQPISSERIAEWRGHLPLLGHAHRLGLLRDLT